MGPLFPYSRCAFTTDEVVYVYPYAQQAELLTLCGWGSRGRWLCISVFTLRCTQCNTKCQGVSCRANTSNECNRLLTHWALHHQHMSGEKAGVSPHRLTQRLRFCFFFLCFFLPSVYSINVRTLGDWPWLLFYIHIISFYHSCWNNANFLLNCTHPQSYVEDSRPWISLHTLWP